MQISTGKAALLNRFFYRNALILMTFPEISDFLLQEFIVNNYFSPLVTHFKVTLPYISPILQNTKFSLDLD